MEIPYVAILMSLALAVVVAGVLLGPGALLRPHRPSPVKVEAFECGNPASGSAWGRFSVKFYLTAILFVVFDIEAVFLFPWASIFRQLGWFGLVEMTAFIVILAVTLIYAWKKRALEWEK